MLLILLCNVIFSNLYSQDKYVKDPNFNAAFQTNKFFIDGRQGIDFSVSQPDGKILVIYKTYGYVVGGDSYNVVRINPDNSIDTGFTTAAFDKEVKSVALQSDGKIIVVGAFNIHNNVATNYIIRLNIDGTRDTTFNAGTFAFQQFATKKALEKVVVQPDGKIIVCGNITAYNSAAHNLMIRLNPNGSTDTTFLASTTYAPVTTGMSHFALQPDGKIVVVYSGSYLKRLNADGTDDASFYIYTGGSFINIRSIAVRNDGKIYVGSKGVFFGNTQYLTRLNADGYRDTTFPTKAFYQNFAPSPSANGVFALLIQPDGKLLVGGNFISYGGQAVAGIMRLNDDATLDTTFEGKVTHMVSGYSFQDHIDNLSFHSNGNLIATGFIRYYNGDFAGNMIMTEPVNGNRITSFQNICKGFDRAPEKIYVQPDGKIILTGDFYSYNGKVTDRIVRLNVDGSVDNGFNVQSHLFLDGSSQTPAGIRFLPDGKILMGTEGTTYLNRNGGGIVRLNSDGSLDPTFFSLVNNDVGLMGSLRIRDFIVFNDGKLLTPGMYYYLKNNVSTSINYSFVALDSSGNIDTSIDYAEPFAELLKVKLLPNNKILVTGFNSGNSTIKRLLPNGQVDNTFVTITTQPFINEIFPAADGKIYGISNRTSGHKLMRFNEDGTLDNTFVPQSFNDGMVTDQETLEFENNGKFFTALPVAASTKGLVRHNADGTYDTSFDIGTGFQNPLLTLYSDVVSTIKRQGDGFLVGGEFRTFDGQPVRGLVRLIPQDFLSIKETKTEKKNLIYPNPTIGIINIKTEGFTQYEISDNVGRTVVKSSELKSTIDVSYLSAGVYFIKLKGAKETSVQKFIKKYN